MNYVNISIPGGFSRPTCVNIPARPFIPFVPLAAKSFQKALKFFDGGGTILVVISNKLKKTVYERSANFGC
jgi:hypothetical protein